MHMERQVILDKDDLYQAMKDYIHNHVQDCTSGDVCDYVINMDKPSNPEIRIILQDKKLP